jgi:hypothetical protein
MHNLAKIKKEWLKNDIRIGIFGLVIEYQFQRLCVPNIQPLF